jgi:four helix bundle protein
VRIIWTLSFSTLCTFVKLPQFILVSLFFVLCHIFLYFILISLHPSSALTNQFKIQNSKFKKLMANPQPITDRSFHFAVRVVKLCQVLDGNPGVARTLAKQLIRSGTSIGANVEESQAAQSTADFVHKLEIALKEARETHYWLKLLIATEILPEPRLLPLLTETQELIKILAAIIVKTKHNQKS